MEPLTNEQFVANVRQWAEDRNLIEGSTPDRQFLKLVEEVGEIYEGAEAEDAEKTKDAIGDTDVVLVIISEQVSEADGVPWFVAESQPVKLPAALGKLAKAIGKADSVAVAHFATKARESLERIAKDGGFDMGECRAQAWNEIKDRRGRMVNGVFEKDA